MIEDLEIYYKNILANSGGYPRQAFKGLVEAHPIVIKLIKQSQHFYVGEQSEQMNSSIGKSLQGKYLFNQRVRLPYKKCTFSSHKLDDHLTGDKDAPIHEIMENGLPLETFESSKRFVVAREIDADSMEIYLISYLKNIAIRNNGHGWMLQSCAYIIKPGDSVKGNLTACMLVSGKSYERCLEEDRGDLSLFYQSLLLLSCKNIITEKILAPEALNKKRRKAGKQELFDYHVLNVVLPSKKRGYQEATEPLSHNRVHLCRGHFKEYTAEHPLFGHYIGLYWWQPYVRGQNKKGIVMKDYSITTNEEGVSQ